MKDWETKKLKNLCTIGDGNHSSKYPRSKEFLESGVPFIRSVNLVNGKVSGKDMKFISPEKHNVLKKGHLKTGDVLFTNRGQIGKMAIIDENYDGANLNSQTAWLRCSEGVNSQYLYYQLSSPTTLKTVLGNTNGTALQQLTIGELSNISIPLPEHSEQRRIAEILSTTDEKIEVIEQQVIETEELKKGLMQHLLTKGIGHNEYKNSPLGKVPKNWEIKKLGLIATFSQGTQIGVEKHVYNPKEGYNRFIRIIDYTQPGKEEPRYVSETNERYFVNPSDIVMIRYGTPGIIGRGIAGIIANNMFKITFQDGVLNDFAAQYFQFSETYKRVVGGTASSTMPAINFGFLKGLLFVIPPIAEQMEICDMLKVVDLKIGLLQEKRNAMKNLQKGLMQQLLTGRTRVRNHVAV